MYVDRLVSRLGNDGVLTVEAPANPPNYQAVIKSRDSATTPPTCQSHTAYATDHSTMSRDTDHAHVLPESQIITTGQCNYSPRESVEVCFYRRWFVCLSVCLSVTMITKKIVDKFVPNFMGRFLGGKGRPSSCFVTIGRGMWK